MNEHIHKEEVLHLIREIEDSPLSTQRSLSSKLNISLGKTNYLLKALIKRGSISIKNFTSKDDKLKKVRYILTKKGFEERLELTRHFLERKETEYNHIKNEWEKLTLTSNHNFDKQSNKE